MAADARCGTECVVPLIVILTDKRHHVVMRTVICSCRPDIMHGYASANVGRGHAHHGCWFMLTCRSLHHASQWRAYDGVPPWAQTLNSAPIPPSSHQPSSAHAMHSLLQHASCGGGDGGGDGPSSALSVAAHARRAQRTSAARSVSVISLRLPLKTSTRRGAAKRAWPDKLIRASANTR